ncbi:MAG: hypothetical protein AAB305_01810 [Candidatus Zixiibacteriota bacterium]
MTVSLRMLAIVATIASLVSSNGRAQSAATGSRKQISAHEANGSVLQIDGCLDEAIWGQATFTSDFLQLRCDHV